MRFRHVQQIGYLLYSDDDFSLLSCASCAFHLARLGLPETFREVVGMGQMKGLAMQDVVGAINTKPAGALLAQAVLSGSAATVKVVLAMLEEAGLPSNVCEPDPSNGMTVLHWAALRSTKDVIEILLAVCPECTAAFAALAAGPGSLTPMMILQHRQRLNQTMETNEAEDGATPDAGDSGAESACRHTTLPPSKPQWPGTRPMHHGLLFLLLTGAGSLAGSLAYSRLSILQLSWAAFLMLVACGSSWVCWKQCQEAIEHARSLAEPMGVVLSWDSEPEDPSLAAAFEAFGVSKMRNLINFSWMAFTALASSLSPAAVYANVKAVRCVAAAVTLGVTSNLLILRKRAIPRHSLTAFQRVNWFPAIVVALSYLLPSLWAWLHAYPDITMPLRINAVKTLCSLILPYLVYGITVGCSQALLFNTPLKTCFPLRMIIGTFFLITGSLRAANTERTVGYLVPDGLLGCQVLSVFAAASSCVRLSIQLEQHCMELFLRQLKAGPMESQSSRIWTSRQQSGCPYLTSMRHDQANISNCNVGKICPLRGCN